jgi:hypothetical protein
MGTIVFKELLAAFLSGRPKEFIDSFDKVAKYNESGIEFNFDEPIPEEHRLTIKQFQYQCHSIHNFNV